MATVALSSFFPDIKLQAPGCPQPIIESAIVRAAIELCERSLCWEEPLTVVSVGAADFPYTITPPAHGEVCRVRRLNIDGIPLTPVTRAALDALGTWQDDTGVPQYYIVNPDKTLTVYPLPSAALVLLQMTVAYQPLPTATVLDNTLYTNHRETIVAGALKNLLLQPGQSWTNPDAASFYITQFARGLTDANIETRRGRAMSEQTVAMRPFA